MMRLRSVMRDVVLLGLAVTIGWWVRGAGTTVLAQRSGSSSSSARSGSDGDALAFQMMGIGPDAVLGLYNAGNRTLYVYTRVGAGNSLVSCTYNFKIASPGAPIRRENCPAGELNP